MQIIFNLFFGNKVLRKSKHCNYNSLKEYSASSPVTRTIIRSTIKVLLIFYASRDLKPSVKKMCRRHIISEERRLSFPITHAVTSEMDISHR